MPTPSPPFEAELEIYENFGEMLWHGAAGGIVPVKIAAQCAVICRISHDGEPDAWRALELPEDERQWFKLYDAYKKDGIYYICPKQKGAKRIGAVVGIGNTIEDAVAHCHENLELIDAQPISSEWDSLADALKALQAADEQDVEITAEKIPEPEIILTHERTPRHSARHSSGLPH